MPPAEQNKAEERRGMCPLLTTKYEPNVVETDQDIDV